MWRRGSKDGALNARARIADERGFTLIEVLVAGLIGVIVVGFAGYGLSYAFKQSSNIINRTQMTSTAELGLNELVRDLREASMCPIGLKLTSTTYLTSSATVQGGIVYSTGPELQFCVPQPGLAASAAGSQTPAQSLVTWSYSSSSQALTRTIQSISGTALTGTASSQTVYGIASAPVFTGLTGPSTAAMGTLATGTNYVLTPGSAASLSWIGISVSLADLQAVGSTTTTVSGTSTVPVQTGAALRNFGT